MKKNFLLLITCMLVCMTASAQWNTDTSVNNIVSPSEQICYECIVKTNQNGITYAFLELPVNGVIVKRLQILDKDGNKLFGDAGQLISDKLTESFTVEDDHLLIDDDGNAVILVHDLRTGENSYTLYKYDEKGNKIWGDVQLNGGEPLVFATNSKMCQTDDGGYVITYMFNKDSFSMEGTSVRVEKVSKEGNVEWADVNIGTAENGEACAYPYIVNAGEGNSIVVCSRGADKNLIARKLDVNGKPVWNADAVVYDGGNWGDMPLWVMMNVVEGPDNGVLVTWQDLRGENNNYQNCMAYIKSDGTHGFATGSEGTVISKFDKYSRKRPNIMYDESEKAIFCIYDQYDQARQEFNGIYMQKLSITGERLWGDNGKAIKEVQNERQYKYGSIKKINDKYMAVFFQEKGSYSIKDKVNSYMVIYDKDGNVMEEPVNFSTSDNSKAKLHVSNLIDNKYFLANWEEKRLYEVSSSLNIFETYIQYVSIEGILTGIDKTTADNDIFVRKEIFSADGKKLNSLDRGINIIRTTDTNGNVKTKKVIK